MAYRVVVSILWVVWHLVFRVKTVGKEKLKGLRQYILCPNHINALDPLFVVLCRAGEKQMVIMGKEELFKLHPVTNWFFRAMGVVPVSRGKGDTGAVDACIEQVKQGKGMLIFPEGTRSRTGQPVKIKSGAFVVAAATGAQMVPCRIIYHSGTGKPRLFGRVTVAFGDPVPCAELGLEEGTRSASALRAAKGWLLERWQQLYEENTTPGLRQKEAERAARVLAEAERQRQLAKQAAEAEQAAQSGEAQEA